MSDAAADDGPDAPEPTSATAEARWRRAPDALWRETPDALVVKAPRTDAEPIAVSGAAAHLWDLLAEPHTTDELAAALADLHDADVDLVRTDIEPVLVSLADQHVIERLDDAPTPADDTAAEPTP